MPEVQLDFKKGPAGSKIRKDSSVIPTPSTNRRLANLNFSNGKGYNKMEEDLKIPLNNPQYNEMINTQIDHYNYYQNNGQDQNNFMNSHQQYMQSQSGYQNN
jgi:hypothetical protein